MRSRTTQFIAILLLAGTARGLALLVVQGAHVTWSYEYEVISQNLVEGRGFSYDFYGLSPTQPTSFQPPVYPLFEAGARLLSPQEMRWLIPAQILLSLVSVWLLYRLAISLGGTPTQGLLAALMMAVYPPFVVYAVVPSPVMLEMLFLLGGVWATVRATKSSAFAWPCAAGVSLALAGLTRSPWLLTIPLAALWALWRARGHGWRRFRAPVLLGLAALLTLSPWALHNRQVQGTWSVTGTNGGINFWIGNNPQATGEYIFPTQIDRDLVLHTVDWSEAARDQFFYRQGFAFIQDNPKQALRLAASKLVYFALFRPSIGSSYQSADVQVGLARDLFIAGWLLLLPLGLAGVWLERRRWKDHALLAAIVLSQAIVAMLYFSGTRFRTPLDAFFMLWAGVFLGSLGSRLASWRSHRQGRA